MTSRPAEFSRTVTQYMSFFSILAIRKLIGIFCGASGLIINESESSAYRDFSWHWAEGSEVARFAINSPQNAEQALSAWFRKLDYHPPFYSTRHNSTTPVRSALTTELEEDFHFGRLRSAKSLSLSPIRQVPTK
jgi:hypothetical protein